MSEVHDMSESDGDDRHEAVGALPTLSDEGTQGVLGVPSIKVKTKTNVTRLFVVAGVVIGMLFVGSGVIYFLKHRTQSATALSKADEKLDRSKVKNKAVESPSIDKQKADIKKKDEDQKTQALIEADKAQARAAALAKAGGQPTATGGAPGSVGPAGATGAASAPRPPTREEMMLAGDVFGGPLAGRASSPVAMAVEKAVEKPAESSHATLAPQASGASPDPDSSAAGSSSAKADSLEARLRPTVLVSAKAGHLGNLDYLLKRGTTIPCALKGGIDTTLPGFVSCSVINDVYSANGATLLVERGATVFGEQKTSVAQGQARVFVLWTRLDNPSGVFAELDSPGADQMGFGGLPGFVDDHFWTRFGAAIMLSLIQDSFATLQTRVGNNGSSNNVQVSNTSGAAQSLPSEALKTTVNIPPTIIVPPASIVTVMVARDVTFESVYRIVK